MRVHLEHITLLRAGEPGRANHASADANINNKLFNTLQLRPFDKRIKTGSRSRQGPVTTTRVRPKKKQTRFKHSHGKSSSKFEIVNRAVHNYSPIAQSPPGWDTNNY